ncbi:MAG: FAD-dependent oxidoreductase [Acidimicrobiia bacterium]
MADATDLAAARLGPTARQAALDRMEDESFDVVVIGAGVTGTGCALDAVTRGLSVAVFDQRDLASGTSSRSSKLIHGGLRYLEQLNFRLVREALHERGLLLNRLAPHLVTPVSFLYPLRHRIWERAYVGAGILLYDLLAGRAGNPLPRHRHLSRGGAVGLVPGLRRDSLIGGIRYWDAHVDDARHTMTLARTAAGLGAAVATSVRATGLVRDGDRVRGVAAVCLESGRRLTVRGRVVVNATGVWTDSIQDLVGSGSIRVTASKGVHLVVPRERIPSSSGLIVRTEKSVLFLIPFGRHWLIGTTDTPWDLDLAHPAASATDIRYVLDHINAVLEDPLEPSDIEGVYAGLRPLLSGESDATSKLSREHAVSVTAPGFVTVAGGKYTTYRVMAEDAIDAAAAELEERVPPSRTAETPLLGAGGFHAMWDARHSIGGKAGLSAGVIERLLRRYGDRTPELMDLIEARPDLAAPLPGGGGYLKAEIRYAASHEGALHLDDALTRRTRISIETRDRGLEAADAAVALLAPVLGWDAAAIVRELEHYRARVAAERESQTMPDDRTADAARLGAPDVRTGSRPES